MELKTTWGTITSDSSSIETLLKLVEQIPENIEQFLSPDTSNLYKISERLNNKYLHFNHIQMTFNHAKDIINNEIKILKRNLRIDNIIVSKSKKNIKSEKKFEYLINNAGLNPDYLILKMELLNKLWTNVVDYINKAGARIIDFSNNELVKLIRMFLSYLNSFLDSLKSVFPFIEAMKEFKDILEGYFDLAEEFNNV